MKLLNFFKQHFGWMFKWPHYDYDDNYNVGTYGDKKYKGRK